MIRCEFIIKERYLHIKLDAQDRKANIKDHVKYLIPNQKKITVTRNLISSKKIQNITVNLDQVYNITNLVIKNNQNEKLTSKLRENNYTSIYSYQITFDCQPIPKEEILIVTYQYETLEFLSVTKENHIGLKIESDKIQNKNIPYLFEVKMDVKLSALFGESSPAQFILEKEENFNWKVQKDQKEIHIFIQFLKNKTIEINGEFLQSNFDRNDKNSYSHSHNMDWDFNDWYHHHGHSYKNNNNEGGDHIMLDMGFAFIVLFCIFGCIFYPILFSDDGQPISIQNNSGHQHRNTNEVIIQVDKTVI
jgi:hypothetical protein